MSPRIPATPRCAARSSYRLELRPSRRLAIAWAAWLVVACGAVCASPGPGPVRVGICFVVLALGVHGVAGSILLRGPRAIRALTWTEAGELRAWIGGGSASISVSRAASCRLGTGVWVLRLTSEQGIHTACIDGFLHDQSAFRALCRVLRGPLRRPN